MSADNFLSIEQQPHGTFIAYDRPCESKTGGYVVFQAEDEQEAIKKAQRYMEEEVVEYGYHFTFHPMATKKKTAAIKKMHWLCRLFGHKACIDCTRESYEKHGVTPCKWCFRCKESFPNFP